MRILFSDEKIFDHDGTYNSENAWIWVVNTEEANRRGGKKQQGKFPQKVMAWLVVYSRGVGPLILFEKGTLDHHHYIKEVLFIALRYGNIKFGNNWTFQQDNGIAHTYQEAQEWCSDIFYHLLTRIHGRRIVPSLILWVTVFGTNSLRPSTGIMWHRKVH